MRHSVITTLAIFAAAIAPFSERISAAEPAAKTWAVVSYDAIESPASRRHISDKGTLETGTLETGTLETGTLDHATRDDGTLKTAARNDVSLNQATVNQMAVGSTTLESADLDAEFLNAETLTHPPELIVNNGVPSACGCAACGNRACCGSCRSCAGGFYATYESVVLEPYFSRDFAVATVIDDVGMEYSFDWDLVYSSRVEIGYLNPCNSWGYRARHWSYDGDTTLSVFSEEDIFTGFASDGTPDISIEENDETITATHSLQMDVTDFELVSQRCNTSFSAGMRYVQMEQQYHAFVPDVDDGILGKIDFDGIGPTVAAEFLQPLTCSLRGFVKLRGSILVGDGSYFAVDVEDGDSLIRNSDNDTLTNGEIQLGVDWRRCTSHGAVVFVSAALEAQHWSSAGSAGPGNIANDDDTNYQDESPQNADLSLFGFTVGVGASY